MYENNVKLHYIEYVERFINVLWMKDSIIRQIKENNKNETNRDYLINNWNSKLRQIKKDILGVVGFFESDEKYRECVIDCKKLITPMKKKYEKDNMHYDLKCNPQDYFPCMIRMMKAIEKQGFAVKNVFPMRNEIEPKNIPLDTTTLTHLLLSKKYGNKSDFLSEGNLKKNEDRIWKFFFRTERQCFVKQGYSFRHMIETDGVSCSILLVRNDLASKKFIHSKVKEECEKYIDELDNYSDLRNKMIVAIDPGKSDLQYCINKDSKEAEELRYTQNSRRKECKIKKYKKIQLKFKQEKIEGKTVIEWETELSKFNKKTLNVEEFKKYIQKKDEINNKLFKFYENYIFRKLKLNGYINRKKHEQKYINNFKKIFGTPEEVVICIGNFERKQHMRYLEPVKGAGFRNLYRQNGYQVFLVDEFRTSCRCSKCEGECEKFIRRENHKPKFPNQENYQDIILVHGALRCKICKAVWNRDVNGATNIWKIANAAINGEEKPKYLQRDKKVEEKSKKAKKSKVSKETKDKPKSTS